MLWADHIDTAATNDTFFGAYNTASPYQGWLVAIRSPNMISVYSGPGSWRTIIDYGVLTTKSYPVMVLNVTKSGTAQLWVNGVLVGSNSLSVGTSYSANGFYIGRNAAGAYLNMRVVSASLWLRTLSKQEIGRLYAEPWAGLVAPRFVPLSAAAAGYIDNARYYRTHLGRFAA